MPSPRPWMPLGLPTWGQLGAILAAVFAVVAPLVGALYLAIDARLKSLEDHFQTAIVAGADVKQLLNESPPKADNQ